MCQIVPPPVIGYYGNYKLIETFEEMKTNLKWNWTTY